MKPESHVPVAEYAAEHPVLKLPGETRLLDHLPQLDGLRAIAILFVVWYHFGPSDLRVQGGPPFGAVGVGLFFVLSGFLITRILLNCKLKIADRRMTFWQSFKQFYIRRFLRIFPLYYGVLIVLWLFNVTGFRKRSTWSFLYLTNVRFSYNDIGSAGAERHLWSLSVEEQFYLVWPLLILLTPRKLLLPVLLLTVAVGPVWRATQYRQGYLAHEWMTPANLDLLGMGAILALLSLPRFGLARWCDAFVQLCGVVGVPMLVAYLAQRWYPTTMVHNRPTAVSFDLYGGPINAAVALTGVWLVGTAARGFRGPIGWLLTCPPMIYLGRISYGLYVLHMLVPVLLAWLLPQTFQSAAYRRTWGTLGLSFAISVALASLSWFCFEAPINKLKRYFEYDPARAAARVATSA